MKRLSILLLLAFAPFCDAQVNGRGYVPPTPEKKKELHETAFKHHGYRQYYQVKNMTAPATWDSRAMGWIPPIRDQGQCGDCFGVEASDALTIAYIKAGWQKADGKFVISEQYGLDYGAYEGGCNGGDGPQVYDYMKSTGFPAEKYVDTGDKQIADYPSYTARAGARRLKPGAKMWGKGDLTWGYVTSDQSDRAPTVDEVKAGIMKYATVTFAFDAGGLDSMSNNVVRSLGGNIDHEITGFVGWDDSKACPDGSKGAFICRNQWGDGFGDAGYFWLPYTQVRRVVEACFLTVVPLPPPPPPPPPVCPPGQHWDATLGKCVPDGPPPPPPPPGTVTKFTLNNALQPGTYEVSPEGTAAAILQAQRALAMIGNTTTAEPPRINPKQEAIAPPKQTVDPLRKEFEDFKQEQRLINDKIINLLQQALPKQKAALTKGSEIEVVAKTAFPAVTIGKDDHIELRQDHLAAVATAPLIDGKAIIRVPHDAYLGDYKLTYVKAKAGEHGTRVASVSVTIQ